MLSGFLAFASLVLVGALSVPATILAIECFVGSLPLRSRVFPKVETDRRPSVAVLVPAHNEESGIVATLAGIRRQLHNQDRLVVVADNCSDRTAELARTEGAEVVERFDTERRGKGFALNAGIRYLEETPPDIVFLVDADCSLGTNALDRLVEMVVATGKPAQSCNLMTAPQGAALTHAVAEFATLVKNYVRPLGLSRLGLPCQATNGLAVPWRQLSLVNIASSNIVEDMKLGLDLAQLGYAAQFCESARVTSQFPQSREGADTQRRRWEGGHIAMMRQQMRSLLLPKTFQNVSRLVLTLDLMVPPLTLLGIVLVVALLMAGILAGINVAVWPLALAFANLSMVVAATAVAWHVHGRTALPARFFYRIPLFVVWKLKLYPRALFGAEGWVRTDRTKGS